VIAVTGGDTGGNTHAQPSNKDQNMTSSRYQFALVGSGSVAKLYIEAIRSCPKASVGRVVVSERSFARRSSLAFELGIDERLISNRYDEVLADPHIDVVIIATPIQMHADQMRMCVGAGKDFIVEKPVVCNYDQLRETLPILRDCPVKSLSGQVLRYSKAFGTAKALAGSGRLGDIMFVRSEYVANTVNAVRHNLKPWWSSGEIVEFPVIGGGVHAVDLMRWIAGEVEEVHAFGHKAILKEKPYHDTVAASLRFRGGAIGQSFVGYSAQGPAAAGLSIYGSEGTLVNDRLFLNDIPNLEDFFELPVPKLSFDNRNFPKLVEHMIECIEDDCEPISDAYDACKSAAVCLAIARSIQEKRPVRLAEMLGE